MLRGNIGSLWCSHGQRLGIESATGAIAAFQDAGGYSGAVPLFAYVTRALPQIVFLLPATEYSRTLNIPTDLEANDLLPVGLCWTSRPDTANLYNPDDGAWITTLPYLSDSPDQPARLSVDRTISAPREQYCYEQSSEIFVSSHALSIAERIDRVLHPQLTCATLLTLDEKDGAVLSAVARGMEHRSLVTLAHEIVNSPAAIAALRQVFPGDVFIEQGVTAIMRVLQARSRPQDLARLAPAKPRQGLWRAALPKRFSLPPPQGPDFRPTGDTHPRSELPGHIGPAFDKLANLSNDGTFTSFPFAINVLARRLIKPSKRLCVIATARNEGLGLLEWVAYYQNLGADSIVIYSNDNTDGADELLSALHKAGIIEYFRNDLATGGNAQGKAYAHALALSTHVLDYEWALVVDLDEFLVFDRSTFESFENFLIWIERRDVDAVALNWRICGPNRQVAWTDEFIMRRFASVSEEVDTHIKSMFRPHKFIASLPHFPIPFRREAFTYLNDVGKPHIARDNQLAWSLSPSGHLVWINHYMQKSAQEFLIKWSRNRGDGPLTSEAGFTALEPAFLHDFVVRFEQTSAPSPRALALECEVAARKQELLANPAIREANQAIRTKFRDQLPKLQQLFAVAPARREAGQIGDAFMRILQDQRH